MTPLDTLPLTAAERDLAAAAADFTSRVVAPAAGAWDTAGLPREALQGWAALGLNGVQVSPARGGAGASYFAKIAVAQAVAGTCMGSAFALNLAQGAATRMEREGSPEQIARYLPGLLSGALICSPSLTEPGAGSDFSAITTTAAKTPVGWVLDGEKSWVTSGTIADLLVMYAQTEPGAGAPGIASFIVDLHAPGIERLPIPMASGGAFGVAGIRLTGVRIAEGGLFAPPGQAFKRALRGITGARAHVAAMVCAMVQGALRTAVFYAGSRHAFGRKLLAHQGLRWQLASVATELEAAWLLADRAIRQIDAGEDAQIAAAFAKKFAADIATRSIAACMQAMGAEGLRPEHGLARHLTAARIAAYVDGTSEIMAERIGAVLPDRYGAG